MVAPLSVKPLHISLQDVTPGSAQGGVKGGVQDATPSTPLEPKVSSASTPSVYIHKVFKLSLHAENTHATTPKSTQKPPLHPIRKRRLAITPDHALFIEDLLVKIAEGTSKKDTSTNESKK